MPVTFTKVTKTICKLLCKHVTKRATYITFLHRTLKLLPLLFSLPLLSYY